LITITVTRTGNLAATATVTYSSLDGTASNPADYAAQLGTLTFAPGESSKSFSVGITNDVAIETNETFQLVLSNASNASLGAPATAVVTITDNDKTRGRIRVPRTGRVGGKRLLLER
jgi:hypothetical protein